MPLDHPARRHLRLIEQALRSDLHFLARHPTTLFQCLWNRCWWYDCPAAAAHHDPPPGGWPADGPPWSRPEDDRLATLLESWRTAKERRTPAFTWLRSLRPPPFPLGGAELACLRGHSTRGHSVAFDRAGLRIVSGSMDKTVRVWDAATGAELACLRGHDRRGQERGVRPGGSADRQRVGRRDGAGLGRGLRGLPGGDSRVRGRCSDRRAGKRVSMAGDELEPGDGDRTGEWWRGCRLVPGRADAPRDPPCRPHLGRVRGQSSVPDPA